MLKMERNSISWIGIADLFLFLFLFFLAAYIMAASENKTTTDCSGKLLLVENENKVLKKRITELEEALHRCQADLSRCREDLRRCREDLRQCRDDNIVLGKGRFISDSFGAVIGQALNALNELKQHMEERHFPVQIDRRPDSLFFDMQVFFQHEGLEVTKREEREAIVIIGKEFRRILDQRHTFKLRESEEHTFYLHEVMRIVIEGHTDETKKNEMANFYYSAGRAQTVLNILMQECGLKPPKYRISTASYAEFGRKPKSSPDDSADTIDQKMRRVTISIVPDYDRLPSK
ncbi:MAG: OmpA family protein [Deltaproteobacteria bacterium]|nr:OmpA family protein [Deltaproteobacteria bacterium]